MQGRYTIERELARGGAGRVYFARDAGGQPLALKVLHPELVVTVTADRFFREIGYLQRLEHPRLAKLVDYGTEDWLLFYAMTYVAGPTLKTRMLDGPMPPAEVARIGREVLEALAYAHGHGLVHRDVKPENLVLGPEGTVLLDFGIARAIEAAGDERLTRSGFTVGTSTYMSPEQIGALSDLDPRSDLYSLGCVLFEALAGRPPFQHPNEALVLQLHQTQEPPNLLAARPGVPAALAATLSRAMAKDRSARWSNAVAMAEALAPL